MTEQTALEKALLEQKITSALTKRNLTVVAVKDAATAKRKKRAARNKLHAKFGAFRATEAADKKRVTV